MAPRFRSIPWPFPASSRCKLSRIPSDFLTLSQFIHCQRLAFVPCNLHVGLPDIRNLETLRQSHWHRKRFTVITMRDSLRNLRRYCDAYGLSLFTLLADPRIAIVAQYAEPTANDFRRPEDFASSLCHLPLSVKHAAKSYGEDCEWPPAMRYPFHHAYDESHPVNLANVCRI